MPLRSDMTLSDYVEIFSRRRWLILAAFVITMSASVAYYVFAPKSFRSSTTILVIPRRIPENFVQSTVSVSVQDRLPTLKQQVLSGTRLKAIMEEVGLYRNDRRKRPADELIEDMRRRITVTQIRGGGGRNPTTEAFNISFEFPDPQLAMRTVSMMSSFFIDENLKSREQQAAGTAEFLESQLQETKAMLEKQEEKVKTYKISFMGELPQQIEANLSQLTRLQEQSKTASESIRSAEDRKVFLEAQIGLLERTAQQSAGTTSGPASTAVPLSADPVQAAMMELITKRGRIANLSARYTEKYPELIQLRREVVELEKRLDEMRQTPATRDANSGRGSAAIPLQSGAWTNPQTALEIQRLRAQVVAAEAENSSLKKGREELRKQIADIQAKVDRSPRREQEMIALTRDYENLKRKYDELLGKKLNADISQNLEKREIGEQFQIVDPANLPLRPFEPNPGMVFGAGFLAFFLLGFGGAIGGELINPALRTPQDFKQYFKIPILASIPIRKDQVARKRSNVVFGDRKASGGEPGNRNSPVARSESFPLEQYLPLQARIEQKLESGDYKVIAVTSAIPEEGKTVSTMALAMNIARSGARNVMLIDADVHKEDIARRFGVSPSPGLADYLAGTAKLDEIIQNSLMPGLYLVPSGVAKEVPVGLLARGKFRSLLTEIRSRFDFVLLDAPPVLPVADTVSLRNQVDGFILIYRIGVTPYKMFAKTVEEIGEKKIIGVVLNGVEMLSPRYYKKYYKSYYKPGKNL